ncbi:MAG: minor capsid protein [Eubacteriales bacterium]|nr:minor capsid protein [Eubacteriales bacterium]MDD4512791.1 minor capsid protein [Eubacteriales bacterium]
MSDSIAVSVAEVADVKERATKEVMQRVMQEAHGRTSYDIQMSVGRLMPYDGMDSNAVSEVLRQRWSGGNYSSRIWGGAGNLAASLRGAMLENLMMGRTSDETYREMYKLSQSDELATNRLIRTESAYAANQAIAQAYEDAGFERYVFVSALEARTCAKCGAMDGESFSLSEKKVGKNYPPVHPWCRCTTKPDDDDLKALEKDSSRWARDPETGEFVKVRGDMTYREWKAEQGKGLYRRAGNSDIYAELPERMSKKHIREVAKEYGISLKGIRIVLDFDPEKLRDTFAKTGRADGQDIKRIDFFPKAFVSKEELTRTIVHEKMHIEQFRQYTVEYVQNNLSLFESEAYAAENAFIKKLKEEGRI